ncbi:MAG: hypothetical protein QME51_06330, partial [Planctomycetota bacterium]|nr:hypothetical protein [Planctomycetota bacterium]
MRPLMIGLLLSADDQDIIEEVMTKYSKQFDTIFCLDRGRDNSIDIIRSFKKVEYAVTDQEIGIDGTLLKDGKRQLLLSRIQDKYGYDGWIFPIHSDEIYHGDLSHLIEAAQSDQANVVNCMVAHFIMHPNEAGEIDKEDAQQSIQERRKWYFLGQCEISGFKNQKGLYYNFFEHMRVLPHGFYPVVTCSKVIIRKHYNMRSPTQLRERIEDRIKTGWQPAYNSIKDIYITNPNQIITAGQIYSAIELFDG